MKKSTTIVILLAAGLAPVFPVGLDNSRTSLLGWLYNHTVLAPAKFDMVPEEDYMTAFEKAYGAGNDQG